MRAGASSGAEMCWWWRIEPSGMLAQRKPLALCGEPLQVMPASGSGGRIQNLPVLNAFAELLAETGLSQSRRGLF
jgi:hypothetical protein